MNHLVLRRAGVAFVALLATVGVASPGYAASDAASDAATAAQTGSITGQVFREAKLPAIGVGVEMEQSGTQSGRTITDQRGAFHFDNLPAGPYTLAFHYPSGYTVWYRNATNLFSATPVIVTSGATTVVKVVQPSFGDMRLTAKDAATGQPLANACFYYQGGPYTFFTACSDSTGQASVTGIPVGTYGVGVGGPSSDYLNGTIPSVMVTSNHTTTASVSLQHAAKAHLSFVDAGTNASVTGVCVGMISDDSHNWASPSSWCTTSDTLDLAGLPPSSFRLFVGPRDGAHGAQWVGSTGGTGDPGAAVRYTVTYGQEVDVTVRLDGAGSISGTVTDAATGSPVQGVCPSATAPSSTDNPAFNAMCTWTDGTYTVANLGPYAWKVVYPEYSGVHAWVWSGGGATRASATAVQVVAGSTVTVGATLPASGKIAGTITLPAGGNVRFANIWVVDATTGDYAGVSPYINGDGGFTISGLNTQNVWLYYSYGGSGTTYKYPTTIATTAGSTVSGISITVPSS